MKRIIRCILYLWQLPQHIAGLSLLFFCMMTGVSVRRDRGVYVLDRFIAGGVSLGEYVFVLVSDDTEFTRRHELGHCVQSKILGPLYLLVVGIPSAILCLAAKRSRRVSSNYYHYFPENWANRISGLPGCEDSRSKSDQPYV